LVCNISKKRYTNLLNALQQYAEYVSKILYNLNKLNYYYRSSGEINLRDQSSSLANDLKFLEKAFKKWTPTMLTSPYIPTPSLLIKPTEFPNKTKPKPTTKPRFYSEERYKEIIDYLHKGAQAYSVGDYGTAINNFIKLLEVEWLKHSTYFYLVKTLIKLDIEKEILSLRSQSNTNNIRMTKPEKDK